MRFIKILFIYFCLVAQVTVTVDGGTNEWMDYLGDLAKDVLSGKSKKYLPKLVTGDMDSISPALLDKLKLTEANVLHTPDQMETDYTKAMRQLNEYTVKNKKKVIHFETLFFIL